MKAVDGKLWRNWADRLEARAKTVEKTSPFSPHSLPLYLIIAIVLPIELVAIGVSSFEFAWDPFTTGISSALLLAGSGLIARRYGFARTASLIELASLPTLTSILILTATVLLTLVSRPFADQQLVGLDRALGFDWLWLLSLYQSNESLVRASAHIYDTSLGKPPYCR